MKHFLTITNIQKDEKKSFTKEVKDYIEQKGGTCLCYYSSGNKERCLLYTSPSPRDTR